MVASARPGRGCAWQLLLSLVFFVSSAGAYVGFDYGTVGENLPTPAQAAQLLKSLGINQVRIYDTDPTILAAFQNSTIRLMVGVLNEELQAIGESNASAAAWVTTKIVPFVNSTNIYAVAVGNEVLTGVSNLSSILVPAMANIYAALEANNLGGIKVSSPCAMDLLASTFPPSTGVFNATYTVIPDMLNFLSQTSSFFMLNVYPWKAYAADSTAISLDYALFNPNAGVSDAGTGFVYRNLFDAQLDATYSAIERLNHTDLIIVVSETGWPTAGDVGEVGASITNAQIYNSNLVKHVVNKTGTPKRPGVYINTYLYELFSENKNVGPTSQRNFGMFNNDSTPVYAVNLSGSNVTDGSGSGVRTWCVAKQGISENILQAAIDFACGIGKANCTAIQPNATCYLPDTRFSHASYAMDMYYISSNMGPGTCDFQGTAQLTTTDPSYGSCIYPASTSLTSDGHIAIPGPSSAQLMFSMLFVLLALTLRQ